MLIDAENIAPTRIDAVLAEAAKHGEVTIRRAYGDWSNSSQSRWRDALDEHAIKAVHQTARARKNSSDIALVIDAMDLLHSGQVDCVALVTSDSDFVALAARLRASSIRVLGFGQRNSPRPLITSCDRFFYVDALPAPGDDAPLPAPPLTAAQLADHDQLVRVLHAAADMTSDQDRWSDIERMEQAVIQRHKDFDPRTYGYATFVELVEATAMFEMRWDAAPTLSITIRPHDVTHTARRIQDDESLVADLYVAALATADSDGWTPYDRLASYFHNQRPDFDSRAYGFEKFGGLLWGSDLFESEQRGPARKRKGPNTSFVRPKDREAATTAFTQALPIDLLRHAVSQLADPAGWADLGEVGSLLQRQNSLDASNYGFPKLAGLVRATGQFDIRDTSKPGETLIRVRP
ncbi:NYN domain-containing protein [Nocardia sp. IFM 10818]